MIPTADPTLAQERTNARTPQEKTQALFDYLERRGGSFYDESVTQLQHALQCAALAQSANAAREQVSAALLHDIGHFLMDEHDEQSSFLQDDWNHESIGADYLRPFFGKTVTEPIRLHVPAKRYLCTTDPAYFSGLSRASQRSFQLQGGPLTDDEFKAFEGNPHHVTAVLLRRWDDGAKVADLDVPALDSYRGEIESCILASGA